MPHYFSPTMGVYFLDPTDLDAWSGTLPPDATPIPPPANGRQTWTGAEWVDPPAPRSAEALFGGQTITVTEMVASALTSACYDAVALGYTNVTVSINGASVTGTLKDAQAAVKAFKAL